MSITHEDILAEMAEQFGLIMDNSPDGVYLWLDETHLICNERLAQMFGYTVEEFCSTHPFLDNFIAEEDQELVSLNYHRSVASLTFPTTFRFRGVRKDGTVFSAETDMIPMSWRGHPVAYHFVRQIAE